MLSIEKPCEIQRVGNRVRVMFENRRDVIELNLENEDDAKMAERYLDAMHPMRKLWK